MHDEQVLDAALAVFLEHGYRRATMADIAAAARMSRPTLYLRFPNKQAAFRGVVERGTEQMLRELDAVFAGEQPLADKLRAVFQLWTVRPFALAANSPAADELMTAQFDFVSDVFDRARDGLTRRLARLLREARRPHPAAQARVMVAAALGFKHLAKSARQLEKLLDDLVSVSVHP